jgi:hypothetical protein
LLWETHPVKIAATALSPEPGEADRGAGAQLPELRTLLLRNANGLEEERSAVAGS